MAIEPKKLALGLAGFQAIDAVECAIPLQILKDDLDRLEVAESVQRADRLWRFAPAALLMTWVAVARRAYPRSTPS